MSKNSSNKNIHERIHGVTVEMKRISKNGYNKFHKYAYATENDYVEALRPLIEEHGMSITPKLVGEPSVIGPDENGNYLTTITMSFKLTNIDTPEEEVICSVPGQGLDKGDKGVYKALTGAKKYWAALTFLVATGDDPEQDRGDESGGSKRGKKKSKKKSSTYDELEDL